MKITPFSPANSSNQTGEAPTAEPGKNHFQAVPVRPRFLFLLCWVFSASWALAGQHGPFTYAETTTEVTITDYVHTLIGPVTIPDTLNGKPVTAIGDNAFQGCGGITSISIPASVTTIGERAFDNCSGLTSVSIPSSVTSLGKYAFYYCTNLVSATLPDSLSTVPSFTFYGCKSLTSVTLPSAAISLGSYAFGFCSSLASVTLPDTIASNGQDSFHGCTSLASITLPSSLTVIGPRTFSDCSSLTNVTLPEGLTQINQEAFRNCTSLPTLTIPRYVNSIAALVFSGCTNLGSLQIHSMNTVYASVSGVLTNKAMDTIQYCPLGYSGSFTPPASVTTINMRAFEGCANLTAVTIPSTVTSLGTYAFSNCAALASVTVNSAVFIDSYCFADCPSLSSVSLNLVTAIGIYAFRNCTSLTQIQIPASTASIVETAFDGCSALANMTVQSGNAYYAASDGVLYNGTLTSLRRFPTTYSGSYTIPPQVTQIGTGAFRGCVGLTTITVPATVLDVGTYAFADCTGLTSATMNCQPKYLYTGIFSGCSALTDVSLPASILTIPSDGFNGCTSLVHIALPPQIQTIEYGAFKNCVSLASIAISASVTAIRSDSFGGCNSLSAINIDPANAIYSSIDGVWMDKARTIIHQAPLGFSGGFTFPSTMTSIAAGDFRDCTGLSSVTIPSSVTSIGSSAFLGCSSLAGIQVPSSVTSIGTGAFQDCISLASVTLPASISAIGNNLFYGCFNLAGITIPGSVTSIGTNAFRGCDGLTSITIPGSVTTIGASAFNGCDGLISINISNGVTSIGDSAFSSCNRLASVTLPDSLTSIGLSAFKNCTSLTSITLPQGGVSISSYAFQYCTRLATADIPANAVGMGDSVFADCLLMQSIFMPGVTKRHINPKQFSYCLSLSEVTLPAGTLTVSSTAFIDCPQLGAIHIPDENTLFTSIGGVLYSEDLTTLLRVPPGYVGSYTLPATVTRLADYAFYKCAKLTAIEVEAGNPNFTSVGGVLYDSTQTILYQCPGGYVGIHQIAATVNQVSVEAYHFCDGLTAIEVETANPSVKSVDGVLYNHVQSKLIQCPGGYSGVVEVPAATTEITPDSLGGCDSVTAFSVDAGNPSFSSHNGMLFDHDQTVLIRSPGTVSGRCVVPTSVTSIGHGAFLNRTGLTEIKLPDGLVTIGGIAFAGCSGLTGVVFPERVETVDWYSFIHCTNLETVTFLGDAPPMSVATSMHRSTAGRTSVLYYEDASGFERDLWHDYPSISMGRRSGFKDWLIGRGLSHESNPNDDYNGDGVGLLMAYALELDPSQNLTGSLPAPVLTTDWMQLSFPGRRPDVAYAVWTSIDLETWTTNGVYLSALGVNGMRTAIVDRAEPKRFLKLEVSQR